MGHIVSTTYRFQIWFHLNTIPIPVATSTVPQSSGGTNLPPD